MLLKANLNHNQTNYYDAWMYNFKTETMNLGGVKLSKRYPSKGSAYNTECDQLFLILEGQVIFTSEGETNKLITGDAYYLKRNTKYYIEPVDKSEVKIWIVSTPGFSLEQHHVDTTGDTV